MPANHVVYSAQDIAAVPPERAIACVRALAGIDDPAATLASIRVLLEDYMADARIGTAADAAPEYSMREGEADRYVRARALLAKLGTGK